MSSLLKTLLGLFLATLLIFTPTAQAARNTDSYDGNIFPIYTGNGSLVPPASTLQEALEGHRTSVLIFYLDDSATSKAFAPVVSALKLLWGPSVDLIPLTTDSLQGVPNDNPKEPSFYWHGSIPQVVVIDGNGNVQLDQDGQVEVESLNEAISKATGLSKPSFKIKIKSFNEYNSEPEKEGYIKPRQQIATKDG